MGSLRKYAPGYKPRICTTRASMYYYLEKDEARVLRKIIKPKDIDIEFLFVILNEQDEPPTEKMYFELIQSCWDKYSPKKLKLEDYKVFIVVTEIINEHGRVNYDFDELND